MSSTSPILDQPQSIDYGLLPAGPIHRLANQDLWCLADANSDAYDVTWPWADAAYARHIRLVISDWQDGVLVPLVTRFFPGHQETIAGTEGMIVTKRLIVPWKSPDDRALLWLLECQAEGDRLLRLEVDIVWNEPLAQRIVDGLLVAQRNPQPARGLYAQSNAESTRVFGNPHGRPDEVHLDDPQRARLVYHVLVNGIVEVPLLLTISDVGEQVAWNGFLSLRDIEQIFGASSEAWSRLLRGGRLWTPDPELNRAVDVARLAALRQVQRLRPGWASSNRNVVEIPTLVSAWDTIDPAISRNLLANLRRLVEVTEGWLPCQMPVHPKQPVERPPAPSLSDNNGAYLLALSNHLAHHGDKELLAEHYAAVRLCAEALVRLRWQEPSLVGDRAFESTIAAGLQTAAALAAVAQDEVNRVRWESEFSNLGYPLPLPSPPRRAGFPPSDWRQRYYWQPQEDRPWGSAPHGGGVALAGDAIWQGCGVQHRGEELWVEPNWPRAWPWWAIVGLPLASGKHVSLLWDGELLHATQPVQSPLPVRLQRRIQLHHADEFDFDPYFELTSDSDSGDTSARHRFKPVFVRQ